MVESGHNSAMRILRRDFLKSTAPWREFPLCPPPWSRLRVTPGLTATWDAPGTTRNSGLSGQA